MRKVVHTCGQMFSRHDQSLFRREQAHPTESNADPPNGKLHMQIFVSNPSKYAVESNSRRIA